jgi:hypothetical protein
LLNFWRRTELAMIVPPVSGLRSMQCNLVTAGVLQLFSL